MFKAIQTCPTEEVYDRISKHGEVADQVIQQSEWLLALIDDVTVGILDHDPRSAGLDHIQLTFSLSEHHHVNAAFPSSGPVSYDDVLIGPS